MEVDTRVRPFSGFRMDPFFEDFFKDFFDPGLRRRTQQSSLGSGVIISGGRGLILTNAHVIARGSDIRVVLQDERRFTAVIVGMDPDSDLAVLQIDADETLPSVEMGDSDDLLIGETIIAIGNPFGFSHTVTTGVVSAVNRSIRAEERIYKDFIQTDASINPGNSGGPLLNINGELIGINTAIYAKAQGIGFAIPINRAKRIVSDLIQYGEVVLPWIGIRVQAVDDRMAAYMALPESDGVMVQSVEADSPADDAGITEGQLLLAVGDRPIRSPEDYVAAIRRYSAGEAVRMTVWDKRMDRRRFSIRSGIYPESRAGELLSRLLGLRVGDRASEGAVITQIRPESHLAQIGAREGDIIRQIDDVRVTGTSDLYHAVIRFRLKSSVVILLQRGNQAYYITVNL